MKYIFNTISGIFLGFAPIAFFLFFSLLAYNYFPNYIGIGISIILICLGFYLGWLILKKVQIIGFIEFISINSSSPDLDNLMPTKNSGVKRLSPSKFSHLFEFKKTQCTEGSIRIFNDWLENSDENQYRLINVTFDFIENKLNLFFAEKFHILIQKSTIILESKTYLKIVTAKSVEVIWDYNIINEINYYVKYKKNDSGIITSSNVDWYKPYFNTNPNSNSFILYGNFNPLYE